MSLLYDTVRPLLPASSALAALSVLGLAVAATALLNVANQLVNSPSHLHMPNTIKLRLLLRPSSSCSHRRSSSQGRSMNLQQSSTSSPSLEAPCPMAWIHTSSCLTTERRCASKSNLLSIELEILTIVAKLRVWHPSSWAIVWRRLQLVSGHSLTSEAVEADAVRRLQCHAWKENDSRPWNRWQQPRIERQAIASQRRRSLHPSDYSVRLGDPGHEYN